MDIIATCITFFINNPIYFPIIVITNRHDAVSFITKSNNLPESVKKFLNLVADGIKPGIP